jgi:uncharacterized protein YndB with AHSA1/START domain
MPELFLNNSIEIHAHASVVWKILIEPRFIKQWSDFPADLDSEADLSIGREILWKNKEGKVDIKGIVITLEPERLLRIALYDPAWNRPVTAGDFSYTYTVSNKGGRTLLSFHFRDFSKIPDGEAKYKEAMAFESKALRQIKELVEK